MKKFIVVPMVALMLASCGSSGPNTEAVEAAVGTVTEEEVVIFCDAIDLYTADGFVRVLSEAYENGKPDGVIWIRVNHSPNKEDLAYMVELIEPKCN